MSHVFHRSLGRTMPVAAHAKGSWITDAEGRRYLDASGGAAVSCLGHGHPKVVEAMKAQLDQLDYAHTGFFTNAPMEGLADALVAGAPAGIEKAFFVSGGSEAIESALKIARQHFLEKGEPERCRFIARRQSYHGNTLGALATGGNAFRRAPYAPLLMDVTHISPCYAYRDRRPEESEETYGLRVADELEAAIQRLGPATVAAFVAETVVGATLGAVAPVPGYFTRIREICDRHGVLLILDEVMCGMGRTGTLYACEQEEVRPDIIVVAKGLGSGYQPIGAVLVSDRVVEPFAAGSGTLMHGFTYVGHPLVCAAGLAVQDVIREEGLVERCRIQGLKLRTLLDDRLGNHHHVGDIRGRGLLFGIELVRDRASKAPFDPAQAVNLRVKAAAFADGLICYPMGGTIDGRRGDHVVLAPPFNISDDDLHFAVDRLGAAIDTAVAPAA